MNWQRGWPYLAVTVASALGVLGLGLVLALRDQPEARPVPVAVGKAPGESEFPAAFGSLAELVPFSGGVAPVPTEVIAIEHAAEFRDGAWVGAQNPEAFTIQVLAVRDEEAVKRFLAGREDRTQFVYFLFPQDGGSWFVVTTGSYPSHELAAGIAASKDFGGLDMRPFPRRMGIYQEAVRAAASAGPGLPPEAPPAAPPQPQSAP